jgi:hypothetical protein
VLRKKVDELFADYATAYASGKRPSAERYLAQAGDDVDELAALIDRFLQATPRRASSPGDASLLSRWLTVEPPLLALRRERRLKRGEVVDALIGALKLDPAKREKVDRYYHELETGLREPQRVDNRVLGALRGVFDSALPPSFSRARFRLQAPEVAYYRRADVAAPAASQAPAEPAEEPDEVDALFGGPLPYRTPMS